MVMGRGDEGGKVWEAVMFSIDELSTIPLFSALGKKELEYLSGAVEDIHLIPGEYVAHEGEGRFLAVVVEGKTELTKLVNGVEQVIGLRLPGERGYAVLGGIEYAGGAQLLVGLELGGVVQLLQRAVGGVGRMVPGVGADVPGRAGPPAELADPDLTLLR